MCPAFVDRLDAIIEVEGLGTVTLDIAYGGMFYAIVDATRLGFAVGAGRGPRPGHGRREDPPGGARSS